MIFKEVTSSQDNLKTSIKELTWNQALTPSFVLSFLKDELCILIFTSLAWRHLIEIKISWVICSEWLVEREQRVDEIERKVSSLSTVTASCICYGSDVQQRTVEFTLKLDGSQLVNFTRLLRGKKRRNEPSPVLTLTLQRRVANQKPSPSLKNKREITSPALHDAFHQKPSMGCKSSIKKVMTSRMFEHSRSSFTSWISCGSSLNI